MTEATIGSVFNTVHGLHGCEQCWGVIEELRKRFTGHSMTSTNPFTTNPFVRLFLTLITRQARRASHRVALENVRKAPFGIYRLLLEEIADHLPMHTLYRCMGHFHARCLGLEETTRETAPPLELWRLQDSLPTHQVAQGRFTSLCLAWSAGHDIPASEW